MKYPTQNRKPLTLCSPSLTRAAARRTRAEGMTLVELMIVVIIMALIATAVGVAVLPQIKKARIKSTKADAQAVRSAVQLWMSDNPNKCPSIQDMLNDGVLDKTKRTTDAWDNAFSIGCEGDDVVVVSAGPDGQMGTEDDIK
jgi:general secretion pathway protein G